MSGTCSHHRIRGGYAHQVVGTLTALLLLQGCGSGGSVRAQDNETPVNTGLANINESPALALPEHEGLLEPDRDEEMIRAQIEESARQLSVYFTNLELDGPPSMGETPAPKPTSKSGMAQQAADMQNTTRQTPTQPERVVQTPKRSQPNPDVGSGKDDGGVRVSLLDLAGNNSTGEQAAAESSQVDAVEQSETKIEPVREIEQDPRARRDTLAHELASILSDLVESGQDPGASALALASLETLLPEDTGALVDDGVLSEPERASLDAVRSLLGAMTSEGELVSPDQMSERLEQVKHQIDAWAGLSIKRAALCTRVDGYGRYETFPSYRFAAGQAHEVIVYTELDRFTQRESIGPDGQTRYGIELSQRLELYHAADDLNTWNRAAETVRDESRNRLRDYYLTNRVFLPANLGVGRYHLKIVMRDLIGEKVAETIIPIEIVVR
ncbi:MAG: hypothetical protein ACF8MF_13475 [Phycisphaerales bacterium JB052]